MNKSGKWSHDSRLKQAIDHLPPQMMHNPSHNHYDRSAGMHVNKKASQRRNKLMNGFLRSRPLWDIRLLFMISNDQLSRWLIERASRHHCFALLLFFSDSIAIIAAINRCWICFCFRRQVFHRTIVSWPAETGICRGVWAGGIHCWQVAVNLAIKEKSGNMTNCDALDVLRSFCLIRAFVFMVMMLERSKNSSMVGLNMWLWVKNHHRPYAHCCRFIFKSSFLCWSYMR